jgi:hypothetical protein
MLPARLLSAYQYEYKKRRLKAGILAAAKKIQADPEENVTKAAKQRQIYCVTKWKFQSKATEAEMERELVYSEAMNQQEREDFHRILQCRSRRVDIWMEVSVPHLMEFNILQAHFEWICDGSIKDVVQMRMVNKIRIIELYLLSLGQESLTSIIRVYNTDCDLHIDGSGATYRWLGILRAAEKHWNTNHEFALLRTELEGISGPEPHLVFKTQDRKVTFTLCVEGYPFVKNIEGLDQAILSFLYICFSADLAYPQVIKTCALSLFLTFFLMPIFLMIS